MNFKTDDFAKFFIYLGDLSTKNDIAGPDKTTIHGNSNDDYCMVVVDNAFLVRLKVASKKDYDLLLANYQVKIVNIKSQKI